MKRRLVLPTVLGVIALGSGFAACGDSGTPPDPAPDGVLPIPSSDGPLADASPDAPPDAGSDATVPLDAEPPG